jgi:hypothetical protein
MIWDAKGKDTMRPRISREKDLGKTLLRHDARNLQLKRRLVERGVDCRLVSHILCRFSAPDEAQAGLLAEDLRGKGFRARVLAPPRAAGSWSVHAGISQSLEQAASHEFTEAMVRAAAALACEYGGWEASLPPEAGPC